MKIATIISALLAFLCASSTRAAIITPVSQDRYIFESIGEDFFLLPATDFGPFNESLTKVSQNSVIDSISITGSGFAGPDDDFSLNSATSFCQVTFELDAVASYTFSGSIATDLFGSGSTRLTGPSGDILLHTLSQFEAIAWNESGTLQPGIYTLEVFVSNQIAAQLSTFDFAFTIPAPGSLTALLLGFCGSRRRRQ